MIACAVILFSESATGNTYEWLARYLYLPLYICRIFAAHVYTVLKKEKDRLRNG